MNLKKKYDDMLLFMREVDTILTYVQTRADFMLETWKVVHGMAQHHPYYVSDKRNNVFLSFGDIRYYPDGAKVYYKERLVPNDREKLDKDKDTLSINDVFPMIESFIGFIHGFYDNLFELDAEELAKSKELFRDILVEACLET